MIEAPLLITKFGTKVGDWTIEPFHDHVFFQEGPGLRKWQWTEEGMKVINGRNILPDGSMDTSNTERYISLEEFHQRYRHFAIEVGDILVTSSGTIGKLARVHRKNLPLMMNTSVIRFHPKPSASLDEDYLYAFLRSHLFKDQANTFAIGAAQPNFGPVHIKQMRIALPPLSTQRKIAAVLSAYDDLIENNIRRIEILEEMAQAIYREWFVNFRFPGHEKVRMVDSELGPIPEGWQAKSLGEIAEINRLSITKSKAPAHINYIDISSVSTGQIDNIEHTDFADAPSRARRVVGHGDVIWSSVRPNKEVIQHNP